MFQSLTETLNLSQRLLKCLRISPETWLSAVKSRVAESPLIELIYFLLYNYRTKIFLSLATSLTAGGGGAVEIAFKA